MADEEKTTSSDNGEWWLLAFGGILLAIMFSKFSDSAFSFLRSDSADETSASSNGIAQQQFETASVTSKVDQWVDNLLTNFSIFELAPWFVQLSFVISFLCLVVIIYSFIRESEIRREWDRDINYKQGDDDGAISSIINSLKKIFNKSPQSSKVSDAGSEVVSEKLYHNDRWEVIKEMAKSDNSSDWRHAIIEADILLEDLLIHLGYQGTTVAERLQMVDSADMATLEQAWQAHKIRNRIAHEGQDFDLGRELFLATLAQFERVFKEYNYV